MRRSRFGLTLIELLVVIAILAVLMAMLAPALQRIQESARFSNCRHNLKQLALANHSHHQEKSKLPPFSSGSEPNTPYGGWWIHLLPFVGEEQLYQNILDNDKPTNVNEGRFMDPAIYKPGIRDIYFGMLRCDSDPSPLPDREDRGLTNYLANWYVYGDGISGCYGPARKFRDIRDGLSNTILLAEGYSYCGRLPRPAYLACCYHNFGITWHAKPSDDPSYLPNDYTMFQLAPRDSDSCDPLRAQTPHAAMPVAFADGRVHIVAPAIRPDVWRQLLKPNDGVPSEAEW
jgi:prepilin-type N-terminal cleavage/methylation domain-containing protein